jgi:hypothetical protein
MEKKLSLMQKPRKEFSSMCGGNGMEAVWTGLTTLGIGKSCLLKTFEEKAVLILYRKRTLIKHFLYIFNVK